MRWRTLIKSIAGSAASTGRDFLVKGVSSDSRRVGRDYVFVAVKGSRLDGQKYIAEAVSRGARAVIAGPMTVPAHPLGPGVEHLVRVRDARAILPQLAARFYGRPADKIKIVGVTGTNGKTTVTYLIEAIVQAQGGVPGVIGTVNYRFKRTVIPALNTTPGPVDLQALLAKMRKAGVDYCAMEVSSHALDQGRTEGIRFSSAIFTNLTRDHLDYHRSFGRYFAAKAKLFTGLARPAFCVINRDDPYGRRLARMCPVKAYTYSVKGGADFTCAEIDTDLSGTSLVVRGPGVSFRLKTRLIGIHNIYNLLAAAGWALAEGFAPEVIIRAIRDFRPVPGRMERVECGRDLSVFVDYAHTDDALRNVITAIRRLTDRRIFVVFGCGGERDKGKRPKMGRVVSELADMAIVTSDNPRSEDPMAIIRDITGGMKGARYRVIPDRQAAIAKALSRARAAGAGSVVLIAGKGHEDYQVLGDKTIHFDDREAVKKCFRSKR
jgi:UDP-N-acetylmuramoyl-L-alanyl-D-glutamate--2,6-diaminopimelate ligase